MNPLSLSAKQILNIPAENPEKLFSLENFDDELKRLRSRWHPDISSLPNAEEAFKHLMELADEAKERIKQGTWKGKASIIFTARNKTYRFRYRTMHEFELGKVYIGTHVLMYVVDEKYEEFFINGITTIKGIDYPTDKFRQEFSRFLPKIKQVEKQTDIGCVLVIEKPTGTVLLQDLIDYMPDNQIDPKHVAWITSSLFNVATFLDYVGICHNSISTTTVFIDPKKHAIFLLGGWWYAAKDGEKLKALPSEMIKVLPAKILDEKIAKTAYDRQAVRSVAIRCLGDSSLIGMKLLIRKDIPKPMLNWLRSPSGPKAIEEYKGWYNVLEKSFGKRQFIKFDIDVNNIY